jgi:hypothetical protein
MGLRASACCSTCLRICLLHVCCHQLLSDAELSAVGRFRELTSLTLNSEDGVMPGKPLVLCQQRSSMNAKCQLASLHACMAGSMMA